jgi:hypothetical protein
MKAQILKTGQKTLNKKVKAQILSLLLPGQKITHVVKKHVPGCGYVKYFKNRFGTTLVNACEDNGQITLRYWR